jgi:hypothetical protein
VVTTNSFVPHNCLSASLESLSLSPPLVKLQKYIRVIDVLGFEATCSHLGAV